MRKQKGIVLIFVLLLVPAIMAAVVGTLYSSQISQYVGRADRDATMAERVAQTGLDQVRTEIFQDARDMVADAANGNADVANKLIYRTESKQPSGPETPTDEDVPACNLLGHTQIYTLDANEEYENKAKKVGWIPLDRENGGGYGRFEVTLEITRPDPPHLAQGWLTSKGQVLTGLNVDDPNDPLKNYDPSQLYPEVTLSQSIYAHNASLLSHSLITNALNLPEDNLGFKVIGPSFIAGPQELVVSTGGEQAVLGDINPADVWGCADNDKNDGMQCGEDWIDLAQTTSAFIEGNATTYHAAAFGYRHSDELMGPLRPWAAIERNGHNELHPASSYPIDLRDMGAESLASPIGQNSNALGPLSLCTRVRMPEGRLVGNNADDDFHSIGHLRYIVGAHVGIRPDSSGMPVQATDDPYVIQAGSASKDELAVLAGFNSRPRLLTSYDLDPILVNQNPAYDRDTYTGELRLPDTQGGRGLTDYYSSEGIEGEQTVETVYMMNGGKSGLHTAKDSPAPEGIIISYEWLRVGRDGKKTDFYLKAQGMTEKERNTCAEGIIHPEYEVGSVSEEQMGDVPDACSACSPCNTLTQLPGGVFGAPGALPVPEFSADIVWPTFERPMVDGVTVGSTDLKVPVLGTGSINPSARYKIPKFDMSKSFQCIHESVPGSGDWVGMKWTPSRRNWNSDSNIKPWEFGEGDDVTGGTLEVRGPVTLEGIELPLEDALYEEVSFVDSLSNQVLYDAINDVFVGSDGTQLLGGDGNPLPEDAFTRVTEKLEDINHRVEVKGDGLLTLREREIRLIADGIADIYTSAAFCQGQTDSGDSCSCVYSAKLPYSISMTNVQPPEFQLQVAGVSVPPPDSVAGATGSCPIPSSELPQLPQLPLPGVPVSTDFNVDLCQPPIIPPDAIESHRFATFPHGGKAGYSGSSSNGFTQDLPSLALHRPWMTFYGPIDPVTGQASADTQFDPDYKDQGWGKFPQRDIAAVPMIVSDPKFPIELASNRIYAGIIYHDEEVKFKGSKKRDALGLPVPDFGPAVLGRVMAPKVTVETQSAQVYGVSGYEYHLNKGFENWLLDYARDANGESFSTEVIKNLPVFNVTSETINE